MYKLQMYLFVDVTKEQLLTLFAKTYFYKLFYQQGVIGGQHDFLNPIVVVFDWMAITCSNLTIETLEQGVKYVQS